MSLDNEKMTALLTGVKILSEIFWGPDLQKCHKILSGVYFQPFEILNNELEFNPPDVLQRVKSGLKKFANPDSLYLHLETAYVKLFISHREGIAAPLYESCYVGIGADETASLMGEPAIRMKRCLEAKGLAIDTRLSEPPDHLAIELEYLYFLLEKGWVDIDGAFIAEAASFATEIMFPWVTKFHDRLVAETECRFYPHISAILCATLKSLGRLVK